MENSPDHRDDPVMSRFRLFTFKKVVLLGLPVALIMLIAGSAYWMLYTSSGAGWLWNRVKSLEAADVRSAQVTGDLSSGFVIQDMEYRSENLDLMVRRADIEAGIGGWPLSIQVRRLSLQDVEIVTRSAETPAGSANDDTDIRTTLAGLKLPVPLEIDDAVLTNITLQQDLQVPLTLAESVRFQAALDKRLSVDHLDILTSALESRLQGYLDLGSPFELAVKVEGRLDIAGEAGQKILVLPFKLESSGNLDNVNFSLTSQENNLQFGGEVLDPLSNPVWNIKAVQDHLTWPEDNTEQGLTLSGLNLVSQGNINDWSFVLDSGLQIGALQDTRFSISGSGSTTGIEIGHAELTGTGIDLNVSGKLNWSPQPEAGLNVVIRQLDLSPWLPDWPAGEQLAGDLELSWSENGLKIPASQLTLIGTDLSVSADADIDIEANSVRARLNWSNFSWPLTDSMAVFSSESGSLNISGSPDDWVAGGQLDVRLGDYPQGRFDIQGSGDRASTHLVIPGGEILGGTLSGKASADWSQSLNWEAAIQVHGIDPEPLLPGWPGRLDSEFEVSAQSQPQQTHINLLALQGVLRGVGISAHGSVEVTDTGMAFKHMEVRTDEAVLELNGDTTDAAGASVRFNGYLPSELLQGASGSVELQGRYSSHVAQPLLELQLQALDLAWNGVSIKDLTVSAPQTNTTGRVPALLLDAKGVALNEILLDELSLSLNSTDELYELKTSMAGENIDLKSAMNLTLENPDEPLNGPWKGLLTELEFAVGPAYIFELSEPAAIIWSSGSVLLGPVCLTENAGGSLCLDLDYKSNGDLSLVADATAVPIDYLRDILNLDIHFEQLLEGHMEWHQLYGQAPTGGADFRITAGRIMDLLDDELLAETKEGKFAFTLQNGNLESGVLDIELPGTGFIDVDFNVLDIVGDDRQKVQGRAVARLDHVTLAGQLLLPGVDAVDGQFEANIQLGGSLANPVFDGGFKFSNGLIHYAPIGLKLEDIELEGQVKKRDRGDFKGRFRAGEGIASFDGRFIFDDAGSTQLEVDLAGRELLLVNTDSLKILTETELKVAFSPQRVDINGNVTIPSARFTTENLLLGEVKDSEDLVIETTLDETGSGGAEAPVKTQVHGQLKVAFGDDVLIKVPGVETKIHGSTMFTWSGDPLPMAEGGYTLKGTVDIYGPKLKISNGTISFPGVPADNPLLNIRAGREIYGNTQIRSAGVQIVGSLKRSELEAYTVPITNQDRAWTLLVTGTDFDQSQGVSGFDVGTYIAPKLYVSYGVSLFGEESVISARYDLKKGFGVKVTSGQRETGLDVSYTVDK
ncbi:translocation/assembly module TamB domain-containing protein [Pseudomonadota bacterium]